MGKKKRRLKDLKNYTPSNNQAMKDVVDVKFGGDIDAFNSWWASRDDEALDSWEECRDALLQSETQSRYRQHSEDGISEDASGRRPVTPNANPATIVNLDDISAPAKANTKKRHDGAMNDCLREPIPDYISGPCDTVMKGQNNTWIVFGRDRPGDLSTGYGGLGQPRSGTIDLVVGRMSHDPKERDDEGEFLSTDPDFITDAARIYISQKTNIDKNFNLANGGVGKRISRSAVGIKADNIRLVAREGIKLVTKTDLKNSQGEEIKETLGVDIIAGNDDSGLQPMARGENLKEAVERLTHHLSKLNGIVDTLVMAQNQFNIALTHHFHISPFNGMPTSPSPPVVASGTQTMVTLLKDCKFSLMTHKSNLELFKANYLTPAGDGWILSRYNKVN